MPCCRQHIGCELVYLLNAAAECDSHVVAKQPFVTKKKARRHTGVRIPHPRVCNFLRFLLGARVSLKKEGLNYSTMACNHLRAAMWDHVAAVCLRFVVEMVESSCPSKGLFCSGPVPHQVASRDHFLLHECLGGSRGFHLRLLRRFRAIPNTKLRSKRATPL